MIPRDVANTPIGRQRLYFRLKFKFVACSRWCKTYTQLQKKPISHFSGQFWKTELRNVKIFITYSLTISSASIH